MLTVFTISSGRSGTHFLYQLIRRNALDCVARHETYGFNPSMFGRPIYDYAMGERERTRKLLNRKRRIVERCGAATYVETSHAFLKSWPDLASDYFPQSKFIHLIRDPLKVAKSEADREERIKRLRLPLCHYRGGDGKKYFRWSLTGLEPIFQCFELKKLTRLAWYVIQWIEIENRAMQFLDEFGKQADCFTLHSPAELNDATRVAALFEFLGLTRHRRQVAIGGRRNSNWRPTVITDEDRSQLAEVVRSIPPAYLEIFRSEPYSLLPWAKSLALTCSSRDSLQ
jgi:hypothetical protein